MLNTKTDFENAVIASIFLDSKSFRKIKDLVSNKHFDNPSYKILWDNFLELDLKDQDIDILTVDKAKAGITLSQITEIMTTVPTASHIVTYAKKIIQLYGLDQIKKLNEKYKTSFDNGDDCVEEYMKELEAIEKEVINEINLDEFSMDRLIDNVFESRAKRVNGKIEGFKTGIPKLDEVMRGQLKGKFYVVAGYNSFGKSTLGINMMVNACKDKAKAMFFSLEMGREETTNRFLACLSGQNIKHFIYPTDLDVGAIYDKALELDMKIVDTVDDIDRIINITKEQVEKGNCDIIYIDYLQNLSSRIYPERTKMLEYASKKLRMLALMYNVCVVAFSQISEESIKNKSMSSGIKGSGDVSSASDMTIKTLRDKDEDDQFTDWMGIQIFKSRYTPLGTINCSIYPERCKIIERTKYYD